MRVAEPRTRELLISSEEICGVDSGSAFVAPSLMYRSIKLKIDIGPIGLLKLGVDGRTVRLQLEKLISVARSIANKRQLCRNSSGI